MMRRLLQIAVGLLLLSHAATHSAQAQTGNKVPIKIIYSALTASNGPVWLAGDQGLYDKYGLDVQIVHGRGASPIQALAAGTVELGHLRAALVGIEVMLDAKAEVKPGFIRERQLAPQLFITFGRSHTRLVPDVRKVGELHEVIFSLP